MYKLIIKNLLFLLPPERAHHTSLFLLKFISRIPGGKSLIRAFFSYEHPDLRRDFFGLHFKNPIGLAAGFDKNAEYIELLDLLGFGFVEIGTVTPLAQKGNEQPRLFRLPKDKALINRMGFNNQGVDQAVKRLKEVKNQSIIIGGNIGKNKITPNENAVDDYIICFEKLFPHVHYFVINVSSPNTPGLRSLQDPEALTKIFQALQQRNESQPNPKPIFVKIAPDLEFSAIGEIVDLAIEYNLAGIIATNTTISRAALKTSNSRIQNIGNGGLSGQPVKRRATEIIKFIKDRAKDRLVIIGVGGIQGPSDAREKLEAGADLIQIYTGFIYEGPATVMNICKSLN
ncbi:MAG: quinone-dependent dihydroorotate dehydrogenase [Bacteroidia bacterium]|nr:quinone-dependent dihydroorotate dehydrogenase [Bacteroidia bacterium]